MSNEKDAILVKGEAIESDDDEASVNGQPGKSSNSPSTSDERYQGIVYTGEAPESDDEVFTFSSVTLPATLAREVTEVYSPSPTPSMNSQINVEKSVLQKILADRNHSLWHHLNSFMQSTVVTASSQITAAEQLLVQSQVRLQMASQTLKQANETAEQVLIKCKDILSDNFLPDIHIPT